MIASNAGVFKVESNFKVAIIQAREEGVDLGAFRYAMILSRPGHVDSKQRCFASLSLFELAHHFDSFFKLSDWPAIERSLIKTGAWVGSIDMENEVALMKLWQYN